MVARPTTSSTLPSRRIGVRTAADRGSIGAWVALAAVVAPAVWVTVARATGLGSGSGSVSGSGLGWGLGTLVAWWATIACFIALMAMARRTTLGSPTDVARLAAMSVTALLANLLLPMAIPGVALTGILLSIVAGGLARLPRTVAVVWIIVQSLLLAWIYLGIWPAAIAWSAAFAYAALQITVYATFWYAWREEQRSEELEAALRELESTRALLAESVRATERTQIARDLHDVVGHHLVALGLKLDAALVEGATSAHVAQSRQLVRLLLADIREVVADLRDSGALDVGMALEGLATEGPGPRVTVRVADDLPALVGELGVTLLRAAQESITNARRHARATRIDVACDATGLSVHDDGVGGAKPLAGHGLESLAERCRALGCSFQIDSHSGRGTTVSVGLPTTTENRN